MKIVYTVATYYPQRDGVQSVTQKQTEAFAKLGYEVVVICGNKNSECEEECYHGVQIFRIDAYNKFIFNRGDKNKFLKLVRESCRDADVLITVCMESFATNWVLGEMSHLDCKKILYLHGIANFGVISRKNIGWKNYLYRISKRIYWKIYYNFKFNKIKKYDAVIHIHEQDGSLRYMQNKGYLDNYVVYNSVEDELFCKELLKEQEEYFINVSNYTAGKNQQVLLQAYYKSNVKSGLILIGSDDNDYYKILAEQNEILESKYGKRDVHILAHIERERVVHYIKHSKAVVMTSKAEQCPLTILEAMAAGKPYISSDVGVVKYLPGGVVYRNEIELIQLLEKYDKDQECREELGQKGNSFAMKNLSMEMQISNMLKILNIVMTGENANV